MIMRLDRLPIELPPPKGPDANAAAAIQELMGGQFGEMSTFMNYTIQSFNFRGRDKAEPYYDLIANIAAEEFSHMELVAYTINLLLTGASKRTDDPTAAPLSNGKSDRNSYHFLDSGQTALPMDSMGNPWTGKNVFSSGNLKLDLIHNFFLECGARAGKIRCYETTEDPTARAMIGYLIVRGGTHIVAYARALEHLTGADLRKLFPIPDISNDKFPEARKLEERGLHLVQFRGNPTDYGRMNEIWNGPHPIDGAQLRVVDGIPEGAPPPHLQEEPQLTAPGVDLLMAQEVASFLSQ
jgi:Mn-containing catalase